MVFVLRRRKFSPVRTLRDKESPVAPAEENFLGVFRSVTDGCGRRRWPIRPRDTDETDQSSVSRRRNGIRRQAGYAHGVVAVKVPDLVKEAEHPDGDGMPRRILQVIFYKVTNFSFLDLHALLVLASYLKSDSVNLKVR